MVKQEFTLIIWFMLTVLESLQGQQLTQRTFRPIFLEALRKCYGEHKPPKGAIITFFTMPEMTHYSSKCFTRCLLNEFKLMDSKGNFQNESTQPFFNSLPESRFRSSLEENLESCLQEEANDPCEKSFKFVQCFYKKALLSDPGQPAEKP